MKLLVDSHAYIWMGLEPAKLSPAAAQALTDVANEIYVSVASLWEIAIKTQLGKLDLSAPLPEFVSRLRVESGVHVLSITDEHVFAHTALPSVHRDPFDRMIVAQAHADGFVVVTRDPRIGEY